MSEIEQIHQKDSQELTSETNQLKSNDNKLKELVGNDSTTIIKPIVCKEDDLKEFISGFISMFIDEPIDKHSERSIDKIPFISLVDVSNITDFGYMFQNSSKTSKLTKLSNWNVSNGTNFSHMFEFCYSLNDLSALSNWDVSKGIRFNDMFFKCFGLRDLSALSNWNVSNGVDFSYMFYNCKNLKNLNGLSRWDVSKGKYFDCIFEYTSINDIKPLVNWCIPKEYDVKRMFTNWHGNLPANISQSQIDWLNKNIKRHE